jgi:hypothetical protein
MGGKSRGTAGAKVICRHKHEGPLIHGRLWCRWCDSEVQFVGEGTSGHYETVESKKMSLNTCVKCKKTYDDKHPDAPVYDMCGPCMRVAALGDEPVRTPTRAIFGVSAVSPLGVALAALDDIASWKEGSKVPAGFDEPGSAKAAREAIAKVCELLPSVPSEPQEDALAMAAILETFDVPKGQPLAQLLTAAVDAVLRERERAARIVENYAEGVRLNAWADVQSLDREWLRGEVVPRLLEVAKRIRIVP